MINAISQELALRKDYLENKQISTIYFGGGTPSILSFQELEKLFKTIFQLYAVNEMPEITLEANPDDLTEEKLKQIKALGINRLSIGVQSFQSKILKKLNRAHDADEAIRSIELARKVGFENISIDLIFSIPGQSITDLADDLKQALLLDPEHISVYSLTIEEKTVFGNWQKKGKLIPIGDEFSAQQFDLLITTLEHHRYEQYEISNFCRDGHYARHNTAYWKDIHYLGVGPGAHSYNGLSRQLNIPNNHAYMKSIASGKVPFELEELSQESLANEYLLTSLRTKWGCDLDLLKERFGYDLDKIQRKRILQFVADNLLTIESEKLFLTRKGRFLADDIIADLFWV